MRNLTDFLQHAQYCSFPPVNPDTISHQARRLPAAALANWPGREGLLCSESRDWYSKPGAPLWALSRPWQAGSECLRCGWSKWL